MILPINPLFAIPHSPDHDDVRSIRPCNPNVNATSVRFSCSGFFPVAQTLLPVRGAARPHDWVEQKVNSIATAASPSVAPADQPNHILEPCILG